MKLRPGNAEEVGMSSQRIRHIADLAAGWVAGGITPALVVLVARKGVIVLHEAFGHLGPEQDAPPLELDTLFPVASISKLITATAVMLLVEDGLLGLNRPVQWYLPEFTSEGKDAVMVHHLLTHTSGLTDEEVEAHAEGKGGSVEIPPPDETQHPLIQRYLILGYDDTYFVLPNSVQHRIVRRTVNAMLVALMETYRYGEAPWASGGAFSTVMDMAIFGQVFLNGGAYGDVRILSPASVAEMTRNQIPGISARFGDEFFPEACWGLGWSLPADKRGISSGTLQSAKTVHHSGAGGIYLWVDPAYELVGAYFEIAPSFASPPRYRGLFMNAVTAAIVDG